jgi:hypothetical protein
MVAENQRHINAHMQTYWPTMWYAAISLVPLSIVCSLI